VLLGVVVAIVAALLVIGAVVTYRMARSNDTVESFRRQIDALSPEARRGVVDQVNRIDDAAVDDTATESISAAEPDATVTQSPDPRDAATAGRPDPDIAGRPDPDIAGRPDADTAGRPDPDTAGRPDDDTAGRPDDAHGS
jgi:hypothetical protein